MLRYVSVGEEIAAHELTIPLTVILKAARAREEAAVLV